MRTLYSYVDDPPFETKAVPTMPFLKLSLGVIAFETGVNATAMVMARIYLVFMDGGLCKKKWRATLCRTMPSVELTGAARSYRAASSDRKERG